MQISRHSRRRYRLLSWLSAVVLLTSIFAWLPAAAQTDGTESDGQATAPSPEVSTVEVACRAVGGPTIDAVVTVADPSAGSLDLVLHNSDEGKRQLDALAISELSDTYRFSIDLTWEDTGSWVVLEAAVAGTDASVESWPELAITQTDTGPVCGAVQPPQPSNTTARENGPDTTALQNEADTTNTGDGDGDGDGEGQLLTESPTATATSTPETPTATATSTPETPSTSTTPQTPSSTATSTPESPTPTATTAAPTPTPTAVPSTYYGTVVNTGVGLRCRTAPVTGDIITVLADGTRLEVTGAVQNGWAPVTCAGQPGWVSTTYFQVDSSPTTPTTPTDPGTTQGSGTVVNTSGMGLRCRTAPIDGAIITVLAENASVPVRGAVENGWAPVTCAGQPGWVSTTYFRIDSTGTPTDPGPTPDPQPDPVLGTAIVTGTGGAGLRCRTAPVDGGIITVVAEGARVTTTGATVNGWTPVQCNSQAGWMSATYLRAETSGGDPTPTPPPSTGTGIYGTVVNTSGDSLRCRTVPVSGATITLLAPNTRIETRGDAENGWYPVICAGQPGWVSATYFAIEGSTPPPPPSSGTGKYAMVVGTGGGGLRCRTEPVTGGTIMIMPEGMEVETRGNTVNGWTPVLCAGQAGWASSAYLSFDTGGATGELWMDVDLGDQYMRVYRGSTLLNGFYVSTGRPGFDTPTGTFYINWKLTSQTMSGVLGGEYYYVPNVPWVMYFTNVGHAIHGAYWHNNFGSVMSHGCINLPVSIAEWLYYITPVGARVRIHY